MFPRNSEQCPLQYEQTGERRFLRIKTFDTSPGFNWPELSQLLLGVDPHLVKKLFGLQSNIHEIGESHRSGTTSHSESLPNICPCVVPGCDGSPGGSLMSVPSSFFSLTY